MSKNIPHKKKMDTSVNQEGAWKLQLEQREREQRLIPVVVNKTTIKLVRKI